MDYNPQFTPIKNYFAGQIVFQDGQSDNQLFVVTDGSVAVFYKKKLVEIIQEGNFFSEPVLTEIEKGSITIIASTDCQIIPLTSTEFSLLQQYDSSLLRQTLKTMTNCFGMKK